jgi:two-component system response regulator HydG
LFLSGHPEDACQISLMLRELPMAIEHTASLQQARVKLRQTNYDLVLTEAALPDGNWLDVLHLVRGCPQEIEVVITDSHADARLWSEALNRGAYDLIAQPFYEPEVRRILSNACSRRVYEPERMAAV